MSYQARIITIFISSPGDVPDDRKLIIQSINGWNQRNGKSRGVFFQPLTWEQMVAPDRGGSGQEVIDSQIGTTYDIYLGLMWSRFGSATRNADSGTEDEFDQAIARYDTGDGLTISFLFKNSPIPQDVLDGAQFDKVRGFKKKVAEKGCLYREFNDDASLIDAVNLILDRFANTPSVKANSNGAVSVKKNAPIADRDSPKHLGDEIQEDELGLFDFSEILESEADRFSQLMEEWSSRIEEIGACAKEATDELNSISRFGEIEPRAAKKIVNRVAELTNAMVDWGEENQPLIDNSMEKFAEAFSGISMLSKDFDSTAEDIIAGIKAGETLVNTVHETNGSLDDLGRSVATMPRVSKEMIRANKRLVNLLDRMISKNKTFAANVAIGIDELKNGLEN